MRHHQHDVVMNPRIIVHGGAGRHEIDQPQDILETAADSGYAAMEEGTAVDAVETAVNVLEDHPAFNAGNGAKYQLDGNPRPEAAIMTGNGDAGAVTDLDGICHAISVARAIMEQTHHVMLSGPFATQFADHCGFDRQDLSSEKAATEWEKMHAMVEDLSFDETIETLKEYDTGGTVGCVAIDADGSLAAGTSTGGRSPQLAGRMGDTPMIGCGTYCNEHAAVSATGIGEAIITMTLARRCVEYREDGMQPAVATENAIKALEEKTDRHAGVIMLDDNGETGISHNADEMNTVVRE